MRHFDNQRGQTSIEYIMLMAVVVSIFFALQAMFEDQDLSGAVMAPIQESYRRSYQFGKFDTRGPPSDEDIEKHARHVGGGNFRIFINPEGN